MDFIMAVVATISIEIESVKGLLWYYWYYFRYCRLGEHMNIGPIPVPAALEPVVPYLKFVVAVAGVAATAVTILVAAPPAWVFLVIGVATALGVYTVPNSAVQAVLSDGLGAFQNAEDAVQAAKDRNFATAESDAAAAVTDAKSAVQDVQAITKELPKA
jgi:hypothetical protein